METENSTEHFLDTAWKEALAEGIEDAIEFFLPDLAKDRDFSREIEQAKNEFPAINSDSDKGMRITDLCCSVPIIGGALKKIGLFIEQQEEDDKDFALRVFQTFYRMSDNLNEQVTALAIFTGRAKDRNEYRYSCYGVDLSFKYNTYHVLKQDISALTLDERAFAPIVMASVMTAMAKGVPSIREKYVRELLKILRQRNYDIKHRRFIMKFIGNVFRMRDDKEISSELRREFYMQWVPTSQIQRELLIKDAREEIREEVREEVRKEVKEEAKIEVARSMIADGFSTNTIKKHTGLAEKDILALG